MSGVSGWVSLLCVGVVLIGWGHNGLCFFCNNYAQTGSDLGVVSGRVPSLPEKVVPMGVANSFHYIMSH